jgi:hypothetical protein
MDKKEIRSEGAEDVLGDCFISKNKGGHNNRVSVKRDSLL